MPRVSSNESMKSKIAKAEAKVSRLKDGYEDALKELGELRKKQREQQVSKLLDAMDKSGKTIEEIIRLIKL
jgi:septal ring factor EnvC (AmiA/AmiB activator)